MVVNCDYALALDFFVLKTTPRFFLRHRTPVYYLAQLSAVGLGMFLFCHCTHFI